MESGLSVRVREMNEANIVKVVVVSICGEAGWL